MWKGAKSIDRCGLAVAPPSHDGSTHGKAASASCLTHSSLVAAGEEEGFFEARSVGGLGWREAAFDCRERKKCRGIGRKDGDLRLSLLPPKKMRKHRPTGENRGGTFGKCQMSA